MSRETTVRYWCDFANAHVERHEAHFNLSFDNAVNPAGPKTATDSCADHFTAVMSDILRRDPKAAIKVTMLTEKVPDFTISPKGKRSYNPVPAICSVCETTFSSKQACSTHIRRKHNGEGEAIT